MEKYQVAVLGAGPGGYIAAVRCAQLGLRTVCIDKRSTLGGTCLNVGCIPSKSLLHASEIIYFLNKSGTELGLGENKYIHDFPSIMQQKKNVVDSLCSSVETLLKNHKVDRIEGSASFKSAHEIDVKCPDGSRREIEAEYVILATGSEPIPLPFALFDEEKIVSSTGALSLAEVPKKLIVVGGGIIGVEIASIYQRLGTEVNILEMLDHICPGVDSQTAKTLLQLLTNQGMTFHLKAKATSIVSNGDNQLTVEFLKEDQISSLAADVVLICVGRRPNTDGLNLDAAGVNLDEKGRVAVDECFRTSQKTIFAIGDLIPGPGLAHKASEEGISVANFIAGKPSYVNYLAIPNVIYTFPEVASVGFTEKEALSKGLKVLKGISYFRGNPRARCNHTTDGFVKILADSATNKILGLHIIGPQASELIAIGAIALEGRMTLTQLAELPFAHPTLSESIKEAALSAK